MAWREQATFGSVDLEKPCKFPIYTVATLPPAAANAQRMALVSDAEVGNVQRLVVSDGTDWLDIQTGVAVAA